VARSFLDHKKKRTSGRKRSKEALETRNDTIYDQNQFQILIHTNYITTLYMSLCNSKGKGPSRKAREKCPTPFLDRCASSFRISSSSILAKVTSFPLSRTRVAFGFSRRRVSRLKDKIKPRIRSLIGSCLGRGQYK
jgi:hypothetical protein